MSKYRYSAIVSLLIFMPLQAIAADSKAADAQGMNDNLEKGKQIIGGNAPLDRAAAAISGSALQFSADKGDEEVSLAIKFDLDRYEPKATGDAGVFRLSTLNLVVSGAVPVGSQENSFGLFSGDNLVTGSRVKFSVTRTSSLQQDGRVIAGPTLELVLSCVEKEAAIWAKDNGQNGQQVAEKYKADLQARNPDYISITNILRLDMKPHGVIAEHVEKKCGQGNVLSLVQEYRPDLRDQFINGAFVNKPMKFLGFDTSFGRDGFKQLDRNAFSVMDISRNSWEIGAYYGLIGPALDWSIRGRVVYGKTYQAPDEVQICRTVTGSSSTECIKGPDGLPISKKTSLASVEARYILKLTDEQRIAVAPQVTYNIKEKDVGVEVPIYLAPDKAGKLSGGLKFAYGSKGDDFGVGIFVGIPFSIFF